MDRHDSIAEMLAAYALEELPPSEMRRVESHLPQCQACATELQELRQVFEELGRAVPPVTPPPHLRDRILATAIAEPQGVIRAHAPVVAMPDRAPRRPRWQNVFAMAALVVIGALAAVLYRADSERKDLAAQFVRVQSEVAGLEERSRLYASQTDLALSILTAADMRSVALAGQENALSANARAYWSPTRGLLVVADRMPPPPAGRIYQVWVITGGQPIGAGLLGDQATGRGMLIAPPPRSGLGNTVTVAVTDEPPGGLAAPSGTIRLAGAV